MTKVSSEEEREVGPGNQLTQEEENNDFAGITNNIQSFVFEYSSRMRTLKDRVLAKAD